MGTRIRTRLAADAARANREQLARLGGDVRAGRVRRHLTQATLGSRVGLSQSAISRAERGLGGGLTIDAWQRIAIGLGTMLRASLPRDAMTDVADAGHLAMQERVLRLGRAAGYRGLVELPTRPAEPWRSIDVALVDDARRRLLVVECWNSSATSVPRRGRRRGSRPKPRTWRPPDGASRPHAVGLVWIVRATARNRALVARYPEVFAARFPGSSAAWVRSLETGAEPPAQPGLVWMTVDATRIYPWRRRSDGRGTASARRRGGTRAGANSSSR